MKNKTYTLLFLFSIFIFSCSDEDISGEVTENPGGTTESPMVYFPLSVNSFWTYNNSSEQGATTDSLYVNGTQSLNSYTYTNIDAEQPVDAFMATLFSQGLIRTTDTQLIINGELEAPLVDGFPEITIPLDDFVLSDTSSAATSILSTVSDQMEQETDGILFVIDYQIRSVQGNSLTNYTVDGQSFDDIITSQIIVNLSVAAQVEIAPNVVVSIPVLAAQDVLNVTNYYAVNVGLIFSDVLVEYELEDLSSLGITLPFPGESSTTATQSIDTYEIVED